MTDNATLPATGQSVRAKNLNGVLTQIAQLDVGGESGESLVSKSNGLPIAAAGSVGVDHSFNAPALPTLGVAFGNTGPFANYVYIGAVAANPSRNNIDFHNLSGVPVILIRDDGTAAGVQPLVNASVIALDFGGVAGTPGGYYSTTTFKGRFQVYAQAAGAYVSVFED